MSGKLTKTSLSPVVAERLLLGGGLLLCALLVVNFNLGISILKSQQNELNKTRGQLDTEKNNKAAIQKLSNYLNDNRSTIDKTSLIMANIGVSSDFEKRENTSPRSDSATFQEQFIYDVQNYASQVGTGVAVYSFPEQTQQGGAGGATTPGASGNSSTTQPSTNNTQSSGSSTGTPSTQKKTISVPNTIQATDINITFRENGLIDYTAFLKFLKLLESNTTRMYISNVTLQPSDQQGKLSQASMDITIYSRKK